MGKLNHIAVALVMVAMVTACANSEKKWSDQGAKTSESSMASENTWKKDGGSTDSARKETSSYWKDSSNY